MRHLLIAALLLLAACTDLGRGSRTLQQLTPGTIESVGPVELGDPASADGEDCDDDAPQEYGNRLVVRLKDGRTVYMVYTGPRHFHAGQVVRVHISDGAVFLL